MTLELREKMVDLVYSQLQQDAPDFVQQVLRTHLDERTIVLAVLSLLSLFMLGLFLHDHLTRAEGGISNRKDKLIISAFFAMLAFVINTFTTHDYSPENEKEVIVRELMCSDVLKKETIKR